MTIAISGTNGITLDGQFNSASSMGFKNRLINSAMVIDQRNAGASVAINTSVQYRLDRWSTYALTGSGHTVQQVIDAPTGFYYSQKVTVGTGATPSAAQQNIIWQPIEGYNVADFGLGASGASTFTFSFWVKSSVTGTFNVWLQNSDSTRAYATTYTISSANAWEQKTVTIAGDTSGTWVKTNGAGLVVGFSLGCGSNFNVTANTWSTGDYKATSGATNVIATSGATWQITGVQLEKGAIATSFDYRPYGTELALCQRYYEVINADNAQSFWVDLNGGNSVTANANLFFRVTKRATPTVAQYGTYTLSNTSSPTLYSNSNGLALYYQTSGTGRCYWYPNTNAGVTASAEL
jgi:hypothetical protein